MKAIHIFSLIFSLFFVSQTMAKEVSGVELPDSITMNQQQLTLNGAGVRSKFFMDLYVGSLYLPKSEASKHTLKQVLVEPVALVRLDITSSLITADKMREAIAEGFDLATDGNLNPIRGQINRFMNLFKDEIKKGDQFSFLTSQNAVSCYKNGKLLSTIKSVAFRNALLKIWLGKEPAQESLKQAMLGD